MIKTLKNCSLGFSEYEIANAIHFTCGFTSDSNLKRGYQNWLLFMQKKAKIVSYYYHTREQCNQFPKCLPLIAIPKVVKREDIPALHLWTRSRKRGGRNGDSMLSLPRVVTFCANMSRF